MSLLREVIDIVGKNDASNARTTLKKMIRELKSFQSDARRYINENCTDFLLSQKTNVDYLEQAEHLTAEVNNMIQNIEDETRRDLLARTKDIQHYLDEVKELGIGLRLNYRILKIDAMFNALEKATANNEYVRCHQIITKLKDTIHHPDDLEIFKRLDCYRQIVVRWRVENEMLANTLLKNFDALIHISDKTFQNTKTATMKISQDETLLKDVVSILSMTNVNIDKICTFLLENVFEPIISKPVCLKYNQNQSEIKLSFSLKPIVVQADNHNLRPSYRVVFDDIKKVFDCLSRLKVTLSNGQSVFESVAKRIKDQFISALINDCLSHAIPDNMDDMNTSTLSKDIVEFHKFLLSIVFLSDDPADQKLIDFSQRVDVIFKKRFCLIIQKNALEIMRSDQHSIEMYAIDDKITKGNFPNCMISKNVCQLIEFMETVLTEAIETKKNRNGTIDDYVIEDIHDQLHSTIPMILERYSNEVIKLHDESLKNLPQQTALFHNNCLYLAWWFTQKNICNGDIDNFPIITNLQELGSKYFAGQIREQRSQLINIMKEFDLTACVTDIGHQPFKTIRKCLRQLELLQNVWQSVLPHVVYNKAIGGLINDFCNELIRKIIGMEDISSSVTNSLSEICDIVFSQAPTMFKDPSQIILNVKLWLKLQQLKMILNASLAHITEQWADGKGPLTLHYSAEEVRHLIRALFQNTSRRADALATIV